MSVFLYFCTMNKGVSVDFRFLTLADLDCLVDLERVVLESIPDATLLRSNTISMWKICLSGPHKTLAAFSDGNLVAISVLYFPERGEDDDLSQYLISLPFHDCGNLRLSSANHKICLVHPGYRGFGLQVSMARALEQYAKEIGVRLLCATISPKNVYSRSNALSMGMVYDSTIIKYGSERDLFYKFI